MSNRYSNFPDALDELKVLSEVQNMTIAQKQKASRCNELSLKGNLTTSEENEFLGLVEELKGFNISSSDWNKVVETLMNTQRYIKDEMLGDIQRLADSTEAQIKGYADEAVIGVKGKAEELIASGQLGIDVLKAYVVLENPSDRVRVNILEYNSKRDILNVYINGALVQEGVAYNISSDGFTITSIGGVWDKGTVFNFHVTKKTLITLDYYDIGLIENGSITKEKLDEKYTELLKQEIQESKDGRIGEIRYSPIRGVLGDNWLPSDKRPIELGTYPKLERDLLKSGFVETPSEEHLKRLDYGTFGAECYFAYGNGIFVGVQKSQNVVKYSTDGKEWVVVDNSGFMDLVSRKITFENGYFVIFSSYFILYSTDGVTWTLKTMPNIITIQDAVFAEDKWVLLATRATTSGRVVFTSIDLENWTETNPLNGNCSLIVYGNGVFVAIGTSGVFYSTDLDTWTQKSLNTSQYVASGRNFIKYYDGVGFICISNLNVLISTDGDTWVLKGTLVPTGTGYVWDFAYHNGILYIATSYFDATNRNDNYLIISIDSGNSYVYPKNNIDFTYKTSTQKYFSSFCISGDYLYALNIDGYIFRIDGYSVSPINVPYRARDMVNVNNEIIVAVGTYCSVGYSYDGKDWFLGNVDSSLLLHFTGVCHDGEKYVAMPQNSNFVAISYDGINWSFVEGVNGLTGTRKSLAYGNGVYVTVATGSIYYSKDLINWTYKQILTGVGYFNKVVSYNNNIYILFADAVKSASDSTQYLRRGGLFKLFFVDGVYSTLKGYRTPNLATITGDTPATSIDYGLLTFSCYEDKAIALVGSAYANDLRGIYTLDGGENWSDILIRPTTGSTTSSTFLGIACFNMGELFVVTSPASSAPNTNNRRLFTSKDLITWTEMVDTISTQLVSGENFEYVIKKDNFVLFPLNQYYLELRSELPSLEEGYYIKAYDKEETQ